MAHFQSIAFYALLILLNCQQFSSFQYLKVARTPIILQLTPFSKNSTFNYVSEKERSKNVKSKATFFQEMLGLKSGENFTLNFDQWSRIQKCGLYANLTAKSFISDDGVYLEIHGQELPSVTITPEVSIHSIKKGPEISGGVLYRDRNFVGLGQGLEVIASKREGSAGQTALPLTTRIKWSDCSIGKPYQLTATAEEDHDILSLSRIFPIGGFKYRQFENLVSPVTFQNLNINVAGALKFLSRQWNYDFTGYRNKVQPRLEPDLKFPDYVTPSAKLVGVKSIMTCMCESFFYRIWHDTGYTTMENDIVVEGESDVENNPQRFNQIGLDIFSPVYKVMDFPSANLDVVSLIRRNFMKSAVPVLPDSSPLNNSITEKSTIDIMAKSKYKFMRSWGRGCIPFYHSSNLGDADLTRGLPESQTETQSASNYFVIKGDAFLEGLQGGIKPGLFSDLSFSRQSSTYSPMDDDALDSSSSRSNSLLAALTLGLSVRWAGLRVDAGWPMSLHDLKSSPRFYLGLDMD